VTVIGVTGARDEADKRGVAANLAAFAATRNPDATVVVVDADPRDADVGVRLGVGGPDVERVCSLSSGVSGGALLAIAGRIAWPPLRVVSVSSGAALDVAQGRSLRSVLERLRVAADLVVVDCPVSSGWRRNGLAMLAPALDVLVVAVNADRPSLAAGRRFLEGVPQAIERGWLRPETELRVAVTGDESSVMLDPAEVAESFDVSGVVMPQWWGRRAPNFGFGPTLQIPELDAGFARLLGVPSSAPSSASANAEDRFHRV
jgi:hypothetical protein